MLKEEKYRDKMETISNKNEYENRLSNIKEIRKRIANKLKTLKDRDKELYWECYRIEDIIKSINMYEFEKSMIQKKGVYAVDNWQLNIYNNYKWLVVNVQTGDTTIYKDSDFRNIIKYSSLTPVSYIEIENHNELYNWINKKVARDCTLTNEEYAQIEQKVYDEVNKFLDINKEEML